MSEREKALEAVLTELLMSADKWKGAIDLAVENGKKAMCISREPKKKLTSDPMSFREALILMTSSPDSRLGRRVIARAKDATIARNYFKAWGLTQPNGHVWVEMVLNHRDGEIVPHSVDVLHRFAPPSEWLQEKWVVIEMTSYGQAPRNAGDPGDIFLKPVQSAPDTRQEEKRHEGIGLENIHPWVAGNLNNGFFRGIGVGAGLTG